MIDKIKNDELKQYPTDFFKKWNEENVMIPFKIMMSRFLKEYKLDDGIEYNIENSYITFSYIVNHINKRIKQAAKRNKLIKKQALELDSQLKFDNSGYNWKSQTVKVIQYILLFNEDIFIKSECYNEIIEYFKNPVTDVKDIILGFYKSNLNGATNFSIGTIDGRNMDLSFVYNSNFYTIQNLDCNIVNEIDNGFVISDIPNIIQYNATYLSFIDKDDKIYLFRNNNTKIGDFDGKLSYFIPNESLSKKS